MKTTKADQQHSQLFPTGKWLAWFAIINMLLTWALIVLGSTVRVTNSGMGCPSWPLCYGQVGYVDHFHAILEQSHRYLASIITILTFLITFLLWRMSSTRTDHVNHTDHDRTTILSQRQQAAIALKPAVVASALIILQVILGAVTVFTHNAPWTVALHMLTAMLFLAVMVVLAVATVVSYLPPTSLAAGSTITVLNQPRVKRLGISGWVALSCTYVLLISGSLVVNGGAESSCPSWPLCFSSPAPSGLITLQLLHRSIVVLTTLVIGLFLVHVWRHWRTTPGSRPIAALTGLFFLIQIALGALVALYKAPEGLADVHLAVAGVIWVGIVALASLGWWTASDAHSSIQDTVSQYEPDNSLI